MTVNDWEDSHYLRKLYESRQITHEQWRRSLSIVSSRGAFQTGGFIGLTVNAVAKHRTKRLLKKLG